MKTLGIDVGTGSTRAVVIDRDGKVVLSASADHVPFRSVIPDPQRYGGFTQFAEPPRVDDDGPRIPAMTEARVREDRDRIAAAAHELAGGRVSYEDCLRDHFAALLAAHGGDAAAIWSIDGVHRAHVGE